MKKFGAILWVAGLLLVGGSFSEYVNQLQLQWITTIIGLAVFFIGTVLIEKGN